MFTPEQVLVAYLLTGYTAKPLPSDIFDCIAQAESLVKSKPCPNVVHSWLLQKPEHKALAVEFAQAYFEIHGNGDSSMEALTELDSLQVLTPYAMREWLADIVLYLCTPPCR